MCVKIVHSFTQIAHEDKWIAYCIKCDSFRIVGF